MKIINKGEGLSALSVANYIIDRFNYEGRTINKYQLQIYMYIIQILYLQVYHNPLFNEAIIAQNYGVSINSVEDIYGIYAGLDINVMQKNNKDYKQLKKEALLNIAITLLQGCDFGTLTSIQFYQDGAVEITRREYGCKSIIPVSVLKNKGIGTYKKQS